MDTVGHPDWGRPGSDPQVKHKMYHGLGPHAKSDLSFQGLSQKQRKSVFHEKKLRKMKLNKCDFGDFKLGLS